MAALLNIGFFTVPDKVARLTQGSAFTLQIASFNVMKESDPRPDRFRKLLFDANVSLVRPNLAQNDPFGNLSGLDHICR
jgi:hypothetical protein